MFPSSKNYFLIINPVSGKGKLGKTWDKSIYPFLKKSIPKFDYCFTDHKGHAEKLTRIAIKKGHKYIIAMGGDGTLNEVLNGFFENGKLISKDVALGILPFGSGGDFIRTLDFARDYKICSEKLSSNPNIKKIDIGKITYANPKFSPRYFINIATAGVVAEIMKAVNKMSRSYPALVKYLAGTVKGFIKYSSIRANIKLDNEINETVKLTSLVIANGRFFGRGMQPAPKAKIDDGFLDVVILKDTSTTKFLSQLPLLYSGNIPNYTQNIEYHRGKKIIVESLDTKNKLLCEMDGETYGEGNLTFEVLPQMIDFII